MNGTFNKTNIQNLAFKRTMANASEGAQTFVHGLQNGTENLNNMTKASKAAAFGMNLLSTAANMAVSFGISLLIQGLFQVISASDDIRNKAQEVGSAFNSTESDINSYKERVQELHDTINDSQSSFQDITDARKELYSIQSEMVDKYGNEVGAINDITKAVNAQCETVKDAANAWDDLTTKQWQESQNEFNKSGFWQKIGNAISGYADNIARMNSEYGKYKARLNLSTFADPNTEQYQKLKDVLEKNYGATFSVDDNNAAVATLSGNADEVYNKLLEIQNLADSLHFNDSFNNILTDAANAAKDTADKYRDMYNEYILQEKIFKNNNYSNKFNDISDAYQKYQEAIESNDEDQINSAKEKYAEAMSDAIALATKAGDTDVVSAFKSLYPELQAEVSTWKFSVDFEANVDGIKDEVESAIAVLKSKGYSVEDVQDSLDSGEYVNLENGSDTKDAFETLKTYTDEYAISIANLNDELEKNNQLQTENYQQAVQKFGEEAVSKLDQDDLEILYTISTEEIDNAINEEKKKADAAIRQAGEELKEASQFGNVDFTIRPIIDSSKMQEAGWDVEDGTISTTNKAGEFVWQGDEENGKYVYVHYTMISPDGKEIYSPEEMSDYIGNTLEGAQNILDADNKGLVIKVDEVPDNISENDIKNFKKNDKSTADIDSFIKKQDEWDESIHDAEETYYDTETAINASSAALDKVIANAKKASETTSTISLDTLNDQIDSIQSAYKGLTQAAEEYNKYGYLSADTLQTLLSLDGEYLSCLIDQNGQLAINGDTYQALALAKLSDAEATAVQQAIDELGKVTVQDKTAADVTAIGVLGQKSSALAALSGSYGAVATSAAAAAQAEALVAAYNDASSKNKSEADRIMTNLNTKLSLIHSTAGNVSKSFGALTNHLNGFNSASGNAKDSTDKLTDSLKKQKEELEKQKQKYDDLSDAIAWFYDKQTDGLDKQIDKLNDANDALNDQKDTMDGILDVIDEVYEKQQDALQERIDALDKEVDDNKNALELEQKRQALEEARNKKNVKIYTKNKGFVWSVDSSAVKDAEDDYNNLVDEMQKDEIKQQLQDQIDAIDKLRDKWKEIPDAYEKAVKRMNAIKMFGDNFEFDLMNPDAMMSQFKDTYLSIQDKIQSNEDQISSLEKEKERIEELKSLWEDAKNKYRDSQYEAKLASFFGSDYEAKLLNDSLEARKKFADEYAKIAEKIAETEKRISEEEAKESSSSSKSGGGSGSYTPPVVSPDDESKKGFNGVSVVRRYDYDGNDENHLESLKGKLKSLTDQMKTDTSDELAEIKNQIGEIIKQYEKLGETGIVTPQFKDNLKELIDSNSEYLNGFEPILSGIYTRTELASQYIDNATWSAKHGVEQVTDLNTALESMAGLAPIVTDLSDTVKETGEDVIVKCAKEAGVLTDSAKETADAANDAITNTNETVENAKNNVSDLQTGMEGLNQAKTDVQEATDNAVSDASGVIDASSKTITALQGQVGILSNNITLVNAAIANLADNLSKLDEVTFSKVVSELGADGDGKTGLIGAINQVIDSISGENGILGKINNLSNDADLGSLVDKFVSEGTDENKAESLLSAITEVNNSLYIDENDRTSLYGRIMLISENASKIDNVGISFDTLKNKIGDCNTEIENLAEQIKNLADVEITVKYTVEDDGSGEATGTALTGYATGTATPSGASYAKGTGNWGLPQDQKKAAVSELGRELLLRDGQYFIIDKPQLMDLKKGDIIFNHAQTESILKNGKNSRIKEFARLGEPVAEKLHKKGNSFADGTLPKGWRKVDVFEELRNSGAVYDMDKFDAAVMKLKTDPDAIKTMMYNPTNMPDWKKFVSSGQTVNTTNNNQQTSVTYQFNGDLSFPNITNGDDAKKLMNELQHLPTRARQYVNRH